MVLRDPTVIYISDAQGSDFKRGRIKKSVGHSLITVCLERSGKVFIVFAYRRRKFCKQTNIQNEFSCGLITDIFTAYLVTLYVLDYALGTVIYIVCQVQNERILIVFASSQIMFM